MTATTKHAQAESRMLALLEDSGLPRPDTIEHAENSVRFLWLDRKVVVVLDLDDDLLQKGDTA